MPNATPRATAQALPEATNRRAVAAVLVGALTAIAPRARCQPSILTPTLFALIECAKILPTLFQTRHPRRLTIFGIEQSLPFPQELSWAEADAPHWHGVQPGQQISARDIDFLRYWLKQSERWSQPDLAPLDIFPSQIFAARAREIVRA